MAALLPNDARYCVRGLDEAEVRETDRLSSFAGIAVRARLVDTIDINLSHYLPEDGVEQRPTEHGDQPASPAYDDIWYRMAAHLSCAGDVQPNDHIRRLGGVCIATPGYLYCNGGRTGTNQIIDPWWIAPRSVSPEFKLCYAQGAHGQYIIVVPDVRLVAAFRKKSGKRHETTIPLRLPPESRTTALRLTAPNSIAGTEEWSEAKEACPIASSRWPPRWCGKSPGPRRSLSLSESACTSQANTEPDMALNTSVW